MEPQRVEIEADVTRLKVGTFACELNAAGFGWVEIDGKRVSGKKITVECEAGKLPRIVLEITPLPSKGA